MYVAVCLSAAGRTKTTFLSFPSQAATCKNVPARKICKVNDRTLRRSATSGRSRRNLSNVLSLLSRISLAGSLRSGLDVFNTSRRGYGWPKSLR